MKMTIHQYPTFARVRDIAGKIATGIGALKTGYDIGKTVYGAARVVIPAMAALAPVGL